MKRLSGVAEAPNGENSPGIPRSGVQFPEGPSMIRFPLPDSNKATAGFHLTGSVCRGGWGRPEYWSAAIRLARRDRRTRKSGAPLDKKNPCTHLHSYGASITGW